MARHGGSNPRARAGVGRHEKRVADNELETVVLQRRCLRAGRDIAAGEQLGRDDVEALRPAPAGSIPPYEIDAVVGLRALVDIPFGQALRWGKLGG